jgi:prevent-host-death family protein
MIKERVLSATEFKAKCSACLSEIEQLGEPITITKRGRPVAVLTPVKQNAGMASKGSWSKRGKIVGDIIDTYDIMGWAHGDWE